MIHIKTIHVDSLRSQNAGTEVAIAEFISSSGKDIESDRPQAWLAAAPYNGERGKYTPEQITRLYAIACENPRDGDRPISHWSCREIAEEMVRRGIVEAIPSRTVWEFLKYRRFEATQSRGPAPSQGRKSGSVPKAK